MVNIRLITLQEIFCSMTPNENAQPRINLQISMDMSIKIEKEADKRGINRTQFIKEAIHEKLNKTENISVSNDIQALKNEIKEIKDMIKELKSIFLLVNN